MRLKTFSLAISLLCGFFSFSQKQILNTLDSEAVKGIFIDSDEVFEVFVKATDKPDFSVSAEVEGETFETLKLNTEVKNELWYIETGRSLGFRKIDDKLAAHKVLSVVLVIEIPQNKEVWVESNLASVQLTGSFSQINLNLSGGSCVLKDFSGSGIVNTLRGNITADVIKTKVAAQSRNGNVSLEQVAADNGLLSLKSVDGDISVSQSE